MPQHAGQEHQQQHASEAPANIGLARVKVYKLSTEGQWQDRGTGHISIEYLESDAPGLVVVSEDESGKALLVHRISEKDIYQRQGDSSIITWNDIDAGTDVAISFQESPACDLMWSSIKQVQQEFSSEGHFASGELAEGEGALELPAPEIANLPEIAKILTQATPFQRDRIAHGLLKPGYVAALMDTFKQCEDLEDTVSLGHLFRLVKAAIMLNDANVLECILKDEYVMDVVGALEYDPDLSERQQYREFLNSSVQFKEVVPITDASVLSKIHQTYRIQYIKDVILPRALDDATYATLTSLALYNNVEVVSALYLDANFLPELFSRLEKYSPEDAEWKDLVSFLQELCTLCRHLQQSTRQQVFNKLVQLNLYDVITNIMEGGDEVVKLKAMDILTSIMTHDSASLRGFLLRQSSNTLFGLLVKELTEGSEGGLPEQVMELLKMLLDPETMDTSVEKNEFLEVFYDKYINRFLQVIMTDRSLNPKEGTREVPASILGTILELLCFCVQHHAYRIKYFSLRSHMVEKVLKVLKRKERWLVCAALRFLRICVITKDEFFIRQLIRNNVFEPVMAVYFDNQGRYNIIDSCILDTIDFIQKENIRPLVEHLVEQFGHKFVDVCHVDTFKSLQHKYDMAQEGRQPPESGMEAGHGSRSREEDGRWGQEGEAGPSGRDGGNAQAGGDIRNRTFVFSATGDLQGGTPTGWGTRGSGDLAPHRRRRDPRGLDKDEEDYFSEDYDGDGDAEQLSDPIRADGSVGPEVVPKSIDHAHRGSGSQGDEGYCVPPGYRGPQAVEEDSTQGVATAGWVLASNQPNKSKERETHEGIAGYGGDEEEEEERGEEEDEEGTSEETGAGEKRSPSSASRHSEKRKRRKGRRSPGK